MLTLKGCPRCGGDLSSHGQDPGDMGCLNCGNIVYATAPLPYARERAGQQGQPAAAEFSPSQARYNDKRNARRREQRRSERAAGKRAQAIAKLAAAGLLADPLEEKLERCDTP